MDLTNTEYLDIDLDNKIKQMEETYEKYKKISSIQKHNNILYYLDNIYKELNSKFSNAYLQGSSWYIGESLINNSNFVYPPNEILLFYGFANNNNLKKSKHILNILCQYIKNKSD